VDALAGQPAGQRLAVGAEGQLREGVRREDAHVLGVIASAQLPADRPGAVEDDDPAGGRPVGEGKDAHHVAQRDLQAGFLLRLADGRLLHAFVGLDEAAGQRPGAGLGRLAALDHDQPAVLFDQQAHRRDRILVVDKAALRADRALPPGHLP